MAKVASLEESLTDLAHENALLKRCLFGSKTERTRTSELQLALGDLLASEAALQADLDDAIKQLRTPRRHRIRRRAWARRVRMVVAICSRAICRAFPWSFATRLSKHPAHG